VLKIDRAFAQTVDGDTDTVLLEAIVRLGHSLGIDMIAEGIEHEEQAVTLRRLGCRRAQGFLFHRPLSVSEIPLVVGTTRPVPEPAQPPPAPPGPPQRRQPAAPAAPVKRTTIQPGPLPPGPVRRGPTPT
jgi:hypothetical protein